MSLTIVTTTRQEPITPCLLIQKKHFLGIATNVLTVSNYGYVDVDSNKSNIYVSVVDYVVGDVVEGEAAGLLSHNFRWWILTA